MNGSLQSAFFFQFQSISPCFFSIYCGMACLQNSWLKIAFDWKHGMQLCIWILFIVPNVNANINIRSAVQSKAANKKKIEVRSLCFDFYRCICTFHMNFFCEWHIGGGDGRKGLLTSNNLISRLNLIENFLHYSYNFESCCIRCAMHCSLLPQFFAFNFEYFFSLRWIGIRHTN